MRSAAVTVMPSSTFQMARWRNGARNAIEEASNSRQKRIRRWGGMVAELIIRK
ncbi:MAG TPA: hypothetical protein VK163_13480 [Opitutaceae bacterium]|nr:hypothetical protein [Opitutaceae bacterium]